MTKREILSCDKLREMISSTSVSGPLSSQGNDINMLSPLDQQILNELRGSESLPPSTILPVRRSRTVEDLTNIPTSQPIEQRLVFSSPIESTKRKITEDNSPMSSGTDQLISKLTELPLRPYTPLTELLPISDILDPQPAATSTTRSSPFKKRSTRASSVHTKISYVPTLPSEIQESETDTDIEVDDAHSLSVPMSRFLQASTPPPPSPSTSHNLNTYNLASAYLAQSDPIEPTGNYTVSSKMMAFLSGESKTVDSDMDLELKRWATDRWDQLINPPKGLKCEHFALCLKYISGNSNRHKAYHIAKGNFHMACATEQVWSDLPKLTKTTSNLKSALSTPHMTIELQSLITQHTQLLQDNNRLITTLQEYGGSLINQYQDHTNQLKNITQEVSNTLSSKISSLVSAIEKLSGLSDKEQGKLLKRKSLGTELLDSSLSSVGPSASATRSQSSRRGSTVSTYPYYYSNVTSLP
ncbi:hypothetical protein 2 [Beihai rhabdo-like virus 1]|uniref:Uncharacterized protein n=1 Tax=Beihai rhabdo-like virus 1 TaxID=1922651 RepID=A0A1L3KMR1_9MONO|nr:hypothetical protein 2 [Beihai rhabdo-like virus 1]APG78667.1 hypothetical protein 2 [Beihai rhabdo-like virus 1]